MNQPDRLVGLPAYVLDASALLAFSQGEEGANVVGPLLQRSVISSVNWAEVLQRALSQGLGTQGKQEVEHVDCVRYVLQSLVIGIASVVAGSQRRWGSKQLVQDEDTVCDVDHPVPVAVASDEWGIVPDRVDPVADGARVDGALSID